MNYFYHPLLNNFLFPYFFPYFKLEKAIFPYQKSVQNFEVLNGIGLEWWLAFIFIFFPG